MHTHSFLQLLCKKLEFLPTLASFYLAEDAYACARAYIYTRVAVYFGKGFHANHERLGINGIRRWFIPLARRGASGGEKKGSGVKEILWEKRATRKNKKKEDGGERERIYTRKGEAAQERRKNDGRETRNTTEGVPIEISLFAFSLETLRRRVTKSLVLLKLIINGYSCFLFLELMDYLVDKIYIYIYIYIYISEVILMKRMRFT